MIRGEAEEMIDRIILTEIRDHKSIKMSIKSLLSILMTKVVKLKGMIKQIINWKHQRRKNGKQQY